MDITMENVMREVKNYFPKLRMKEQWRVENGVLLPSDMLLCGDLIAIGGSMRNNGVYEVQEGGRLEGVQEESWFGTVWLLCPPPAFVALCDEIAAWQKTQPVSSLRRESFGSYSRENAISPSGLPMRWQDVFRAELLPYRRMFTEVKLG